MVRRGVLLGRVGGRRRILWRVGIGLCLIFQGVRLIKFLLFRGYFMICLENSIVSRPILSRTSSGRSTGDRSTKLK